jgi:hypothetical protein
VSNHELKGESKMSNNIVYESEFYRINISNDRRQYIVVWKEKEDIFYYMSSFEEHLFRKLHAEYKRTGKGDNMIDVYCRTLIDWENCLG